MTLDVGTTVRRRDTKATGVVLDGTSNWPSVKVAFGGPPLWLHAEDLVIGADSPDEQLAAGRLGDSAEHCLRIRALYLRHAYQYDPRASLTNSRIEPQPHQVFIAHRVTRKLRPRMLLADEVGLGKTIEAGLIIKELSARDQAARILIVCPASLATQWQSEMLSKFNEEFHIVDGVAAKHLERANVNPFHAVDKVICSLPFATRAPRSDQIVESPWDLVVFDEAHRVRRTTAKTTQAYELADELKEQADGLLLLSATPMQLESHELYSLIQLVEPGIFRSEREFEARRRDTPALNDLVRGVDQWNALSEVEQGRLLERHRPLLAEVGVGGRDRLDDDHDREVVLDDLAAKHPLSDVVVRNRKAELGMAGRRHARMHRVELSVVEREVYELVTEYLRDGYQAAQGGNPALGFLMVTYHKLLASSSHALKASLLKRRTHLGADAAKRRAARRLPDLEEDPLELSDTLADVEAQAGLLLERELLLIEDIVDRLATVRDTKIQKLVEILDEVRDGQVDAKFVVFTQFVETQQFLATTLRANGYRVSVFNGRMSLDDKDRAVRDFRESGDVLLSTEAGGEGRNLQFANHIVNFDLPWNPMKVEQRIGRLDRIGQKLPVVIHNLYCGDTLEERIVQVLHGRIRLFEESVGALDPILGDVEKDFERLAFTRDPLDFVRYGDSLEARVKHQRLADERLRDFALDRTSLRRDKANEILDSQPMADQQHVEAFVREALDHLGGRLLEGEGGEMAVQLSPRLATRLGRKRPHYRGTFRTATALQRDDLDFFAFGHEVVDSLVEHLASGDESAPAACVDGSLPPGVWVELVWRIRADTGLPTGRLIRHLVGLDLQVVRSEVDCVPSAEPTTAPAPAWATEAVQASQIAFQSELAAVRRQLTDELQQVQARRLEQAERLHEYKRERLRLRINQAQEWLDERKRGPLSAKDRKILPARQGKLAKDHERLTRLREEYEVERDRIKAQALSLDADVLWASLVVGR